MGWILVILIIVMAACEIKKAGSRLDQYVAEQEKESQHEMEQYARWLDS